MAETHNFQARHLHSITRRIFVAVGATRHIADDVAEILVNANLAGHDSHGVLRIPAYLRIIENGGLVPNVEPEVKSETANTMIFDGKNCFGHYIARQAMNRAIEKAKAADMCSVSIINTGHIGRLGDYAEAAAAAGCIGIITTGGGGRMQGITVPFGGAGGATGTNPIAVGVPTGDDAPFVIDIATSMIAEGKIQVARSKGEDLPEGHIVDKNGNPSIKPADFYDGGFLLPFGLHKGYSIGLLVCLLGGLAGTFDIEKGAMGGCFMQVINVNAMTPLKAYQQGVRAFLDGIKSIPPAPGFNEVLVPGDFEHQNRVQRLADGIEIPDTIRQQISECAEKLGVSMSEDAVEAADAERYE